MVVIDLLQYQFQFYTNNCFNKACLNVLGDISRGAMKIKKINNISENYLFWEIFGKVLVLKFEKKFKSVSLYMSVRKPSENGQIT